MSSCGERRRPSIDTPSSRVEPISRGCATRQVRIASSSRSAGRPGGTRPNAAPAGVPCCLRSNTQFPSGLPFPATSTATRSTPRLPVPAIRNALSTISACAAEGRRSLGQALYVALERGRQRLRDGPRQVGVTRPSHERPSPSLDAAPRIQKMHAGSRPHLGDELPHRLGRGGEWRRRRDVVAPGIDQLVDHVQRLPAVGPELSRRQDQAGGQTQQVEPDRTDHAVVEIIQVEDRRRLPLVAFVGDERAEVLDMQVPRQPPVSGRPRRQRPVRSQKLIKEGRRAAEECERGGSHARHFAVEGIGEATGAGAIVGDLTLGEGHRVETPHRRSRIRRREPARSALGEELARLSPHEGVVAAEAVEIRRLVADLLRLLGVAFALERDRRGDTARGDPAGWPAGARSPRGRSSSRRWR